nr:hypothetical protein [Oscillospiraceae bacterium]
MSTAFWYYKEKSENGVVFCWTDGANYTIKMHSPEINNLQNRGKLYDAEDIQFFDYNLGLYIWKEGDWQCLADERTEDFSGMLELPELLRTLRNKNVETDGQREVIYADLADEDVEYQCTMHTLWDYDDFFEIRKTKDCDGRSERPSPWYHMVISTGNIAIRLIALSDEDIGQFQHMTEDFIQYALNLWNKKQDAYNMLLAEQFCCLDGALCERIFDENQNCVTEQVRATFSVGETVTCLRFLNEPDGILTDCETCKILSVNENIVTVEGYVYGTFQN